MNPRSLLTTLLVISAAALAGCAKNGATNPDATMSPTPTTVTAAVTPTPTPSPSPTPTPTPTATPASQ